MKIKRLTHIQERGSVKDKVILMPQILRSTVTTLPMISACVPSMGE